MMSMYSPDYSNRTLQTVLSLQEYRQFTFIHYKIWETLDILRQEYSHEFGTLRALLFSNGETLFKIPPRKLDYDLWLVTIYHSSAINAECLLELVRVNLWSAFDHYQSAREILDLFTQIKRIYRTIAHGQDDLCIGLSADQQWIERLVLREQQSIMEILHELLHPSSNPKDYMWYLKEYLFYVLLLPLKYLTRIYEHAQSMFPNSAQVKYLGTIAFPKFEGQIML